jgi:hypothetical protein
MTVSDNGSQLQGGGVNYDSFAIGICALSKPHQPGVARAQKLDVESWAASDFGRHGKYSRCYVCTDQYYCNLTKYTDMTRALTQQRARAKFVVFHRISTTPAYSSRY